MNMELTHQIYAGLAPWFALSLLLLGRSPHPSRTRIIGSLLLGFFLLRIPVGGWHPFAWIRVLEPNPSFTLTALLTVALWQRISYGKFFSVQDWNAAWLFGGLAALALYPMGLGLTSFDPFVWGWGAFLPIATALFASILLLRGNRFGIILLLTPAGFLLHLQESQNFWNAVIDPFYAGFSLIAGAVLLSRKRD